MKDIQSSTTRAVAYVRVSSDRQKDNVSKENQKERIISKFEADGIEIVEWFTDDGLSAKNAERKELKQMIAFATSPGNQIDYVLVYSLSRLSRDMGTFMQSIKVILKKHNVGIKSVLEHTDDSPVGNFLENLFIGVAQLDNEMKMQYTKDNMRALASQGYWQNAPPLGYDTTKIPNEYGQLRPSIKPNDFAPLVRKVLERFSQGDVTKAALARYAKEIGLKSRTGKALTETSIRLLLMSAVHAGYVSGSLTDNELVEGKHEPIISIQTYQLNQALLSDNKNLRFGELHKRRNESYPLRGVLLCSNCMNPMYASAPRTGNGGSSPRYHCARSTCKGKSPSVKATAVHEEFVALLNRAKPSKELLDLYETILIRKANRNLENLNLKIRNLRNQLDDVSTKRSNVIMKVVEGLLSVTEKDVALDMLESKKALLTADLFELEQQQNLRETDIRTAIDVMRSVDSQWQKSDFTNKQRFQSMLFPKGLIFDAANHRFGTSVISPLYRLEGIEKASEEALKSNLVAGPGLEPGTSWL